jgi:hypothetical protein
MPVPSDVQMTIAQRYSTLAESVTHDPSSENTVLAPHFNDRAKMKLESFEYDPLTVIVQKIVRVGDRLEVHAQYVGVHGHNANTVDHWVQAGDQWYLLDRT